MTELPFEAPLPWLWSCHHCHARYPLGVTRRCLHDGHYFCGGTTVSPLTGKTVKRHKACGSEFDYRGWEDVLQWRNRILDAKLNIFERLKRKGSCEHSCKYPSACHHRGENFLGKKDSNAAKREIAFSRSQLKDADSESFLDPDYFETESTPVASRAAETDVLAAFPMSKTTLSTIQDLNRKTFPPSRSAPQRPLSSSPPTIFATGESGGALSPAKELGLVIPAPDLSTDSSSISSFFSPDSSPSSSDEALSITSADTDSNEDLDEEESEEGTSQLPLPPKPIHVTTTHSNISCARKPLHITLLPLKNISDPSTRPPLDIDMTDCIPCSPTSPTSPPPPPPLPPFKRTSTSTAVTVGTKTGRSLLTPKSPDSPTNPLFRHNGDNTSNNRLESEQSTAAPLSPLSPKRSSWDLIRAGREV